MLQSLPNHTINIHSPGNVSASIVQVHCFELLMMDSLAEDWRKLLNYNNFDNKILQFGVKTTFNVSVNELCPKTDTPDEVHCGTRFLIPA